MRLSFFILGEPVAKAAAKSAVVHGFVHRYTSAKTRNAMADMRSQALSQVPPQTQEFIPFSNPLRVKIEVYRSRPKSKPKAIYPATRPDIDNYIKLVFDAMNTVIWQDDNQVVELQAFKRYGDKPGIRIEIEGVEG